MHTVELLEQAMELAARLGYTIRQDSMAGHGGYCELKGKKLFFLDLDLGPDDQLEQLVDTLRLDPATASQPIPEGLRPLLRKLEFE
ncbi:MAG: hypothetical protein ABFC96_15825 [Thermoguttaceae bacterium]